MCMMAICRPHGPPDTLLLYSQCTAASINVNHSYMWCSSNLDITQYRPGNRRRITEFYASG